MKKFWEQTTQQTSLLNTWADTSVFTFKDILVLTTDPDVHRWALQWFRAMHVYSHSINSLPFIQTFVFKQSDRLVRWWAQPDINIGLWYNFPSLRDFARFWHLAKCLLICLTYFLTQTTSALLGASIGVDFICCSFGSPPQQSCLAMGECLTSLYITLILSQLEGTSVAVAIFA